jgi:hypothetical protein
MADDADVNVSTDTSTDTGSSGTPLPDGTVGISNSKGDVILMQDSPTNKARIQALLKTPGYSMIQTMPSTGSSSDSAGSSLAAAEGATPTPTSGAPADRIPDSTFQQMAASGNMVQPTPPYAPQTPGAAPSGGAMQPVSTGSGNQAINVDQSLDPTKPYDPSRFAAQGNKTGGLVDYEGESSDSTKKLSPDAQKAFNDQVAAENDSMGKVRDYLHAQADVNIAAANNKAALLQQQTDEIHADRMAQQNEYNRRLGEIDDTTNQLKKMSVDPSKAYGDGVTPSRILAGLGIALGALGSARTGGPNQAIQIMNDTIARDIDAQKANIAKVQAVGDMQRGGLSAYMKVTDNENTARNLEHARQLDLADAQVAKLQAGISDQKNAAVLAQMRQGIAQERTKFLASATSDVHTSTVKSMMPGMMGKSDNGVNKEVTDSERMGQRFDGAADEIDQSLKTGQGPAAAGTFTKALNDMKRKVGGDDPALTAKMEEWQNLYVDQAVNQGLTRKEGMAKFEDIVGRSTDNPKTLSALFRQEAKTSYGDANAKRQQYGSMGYRLPGQLPESQAARDKRLKAKKNPTVGQ